MSKVESDMAIRLREAIDMSKFQAPPEEVMEKVIEEMPEELKDGYLSSRELSQRISHQNTGYLVNKNHYNQAFGIMKYLSKYYSESFMTINDGLKDYMDTNNISNEFKTALIKNNYLATEGTRQNTTYKWIGNPIIKEDDAYKVALFVKESRGDRMKTNQPYYSAAQRNFIIQKIHDGVDLHDLIRLHPKELADKTERSIRNQYNKLKRQIDEEKAKTNMKVIRSGKIPSLDCELNRELLPLEQKRAFSLYEELVFHYMWFNGATSIEIAKTLERSKQTIYQKQYRIRKDFIDNEPDYLKNYLLKHSFELNELYVAPEPEVEEPEFHEPDENLFEQENQPVQEAEPVPQEKIKKKKFDPHSNNLMRVLIDEMDKNKKRIKKVEKENRKLKKTMNLILHMISENLTK